MNERQLIVCAIALFADGYSHEAIAKALGVAVNEAVELTGRGADEQRARTMGYMESTRDKSGDPVSRDDP